MLRSVLTTGHGAEGDREELGSFFCSLGAQNSAKLVSFVGTTNCGHHAPLPEIAESFRSVFSWQWVEDSSEQRALKQTWKLLCLWVAWLCQGRDALLIKSRLSSFLLAWKSAHKVLFSKPVIELVCQVPFPFKLTGRMAEIIQIQAIPELSQWFLTVSCLLTKF